MIHSNPPVSSQLSENTRYTNQRLLKQLMVISSAFINWESSILSSKRKLKLIGNRKKKMTPKQRNGKSVIHFTRFLRVSRIKKGNRCEVTMKNNVKHRGEVKFIGETEFKKDTLWIGVRLDEPFGKNNGSVEGKQYFECEKNYGVFVLPASVEVGDFPEKDELDFSDDEI